MQKLLSLSAMQRCIAPGTIATRVVGVVGSSQWAHRLVGASRTDPWARWGLGPPVTGPPSIAPNPSNCFFLSPLSRPYSLRISTCISNMYSTRIHKPRYGPWTLDLQMPLTPEPQSSGLRPI